MRVKKSMRALALAMSPVLAPVPAPVLDPMVALSAALAQALGRPGGDQAVKLVFRARPDIAALQALVDRAWADLQARLAAAGVQIGRAHV